MRNLHLVFTAICLLLITEKLQAQDLDPRAYAWIPANVSFLVTGFGYSHGGVITDASLPVKDITADVETPSLGAGHMFGLFGKSAQVSAALPYSWAQVSGMIGEGKQSTTRSGIGDMRLRLSVLFHGAPAVTPAEFAKAPRRTILGASLSITAPTGQYFPEKLINLGTSRWSFKPELALSQPVGKGWLIDLYAGTWFFTDNNSYYPGNSVRSQNPMTAFQGHFSYNLSPRMWAALDLTFYAGGSSSIDGIESDDRQENSRIGTTLVLPVGKKNSLKFAYSRGAIIRYGTDFSSFSVGWQTSFFRQPKKA